MEFFCFMNLVFKLQMFYQQLPNTVPKQQKFSLRDIQNSTPIDEPNQEQNDTSEGTVSYIMLLSTDGQNGGSPWWQFSPLPKKSFQSPIYVIKYRELFSDIQIYIISGQQVCSLNNIRKKI